MEDRGGGAAQGAAGSPRRSNLSPHYAIGLTADPWRRPHAPGDGSLARCAEHNAPGFAQREERMLSRPAPR